MAWRKSSAPRESENRRKGNPLNESSGGAIGIIRHSMDFASWKDRKVLAGSLKTIYRAKDADAGKAALEAFDASHRGQKYPAIAQSWRRNWERVIPFFAFPEAVRRIIYTTNAIEALNAKLRRAVRTRGHCRKGKAL